MILFQELYAEAFPAMKRGIGSPGGPGALSRALIWILRDSRPCSTSRSCT